VNGAAAIDAAKARFAVGWPLLVLMLALYSPIAGLPRLALIAAGLYFLSRPAAPPPGRGDPPSPKPSTARPRDHAGKWIK
jgi:hypothetical protein